MQIRLKMDVFSRFIMLMIIPVLMIVKGNHCSAQTGYELAKTMFAETKKIKSMKFTMKKMERIDNDMKVQINSAKLSLDPFKIYSIQKSPNEGLEMLYCAGEFNDKAWINPNGFPWFSLKLDPMGSIMRDDQHHTIINSGYDHVISILEHLFDKYGEETKTMVKKLKPIKLNGRECLGIEFNNSHYKFISHKVKKGETILTIADSLKVSEYMVLERNKSVDEYDDIEPGQIILIPNDYSPRMVIYMDKNKMVPLMMKIYDDIGVYEVYEYFDVSINHKFKSEEFSPEYSGYNF